MTTNEEVLNSWKEVATYMGRGVRTVQRWEQELGLPVRRPRGKSRSAVIAFRSELDQWLHRAPSEAIRPERAEAPAPRVVRPGKYERQAMLHDRTAVLVSTAQALLLRSSNLCEQLKVTRQRIERTVLLATVNVEHNAKNGAAVSVSKAPVSTTTPATVTRPPDKHQAIAS